MPTNTSEEFESIFTEMIGHLDCKYHCRNTLISRINIYFRYVLKCQHLLENDLLLDIPLISALAISAVIPESLAFWDTIAL